jgi:hypothetical protein
MGFPNSPVDPEIVQWGWPWHGRIESAVFGAATGTLRLPSGATMNIGRPTDHWTYLWDIGMPAPDSDSENPDEQWWNRSILRSAASSSDATVAYWYGGVGAGGNVQRYPMYVPGRGVLMRRFEVQFNSNVTQATITLSVPGFADVSRTYTPAQLGLDVSDATPTSVQRTAMDCSPDGCATLMLLTPFRTAFEPVELFGRAIIELRARVLESGQLDFELTVISRYSDKTFSYENGFATQADEQALYMYRFVSDTGDIHDGPTRPSTGNWQPIASWPVGSNYRQHIDETPCWAWYDANGAVEVLRYRHTALEECNYSGTYSSRSGFQRQTSIRQLLAGSRSASLVEITNANLSGNQSTTTESDTYTVDGELISSTSYVAPADINTFSPGYLPPSAVTPQIDAELSRGYLVVSNKLLAPCIRQLSRDGGVTQEDWAGNALHPGGADVGRHIRLSTWPVADRNRWQTGSFNPITGQVVRHLRDLYCTWV